MDAGTQMAIVNCSQMANGTNAKWVARYPGSAGFQPAKMVEWFGLRPRHSFRHRCRRGGASRPGEPLEVER